MGDITTPPEDTTVEYGKDAVLQCISDSTEDRIEWIDDHNNKIFSSDNGVSDPDKYEWVGTGTDYSIKIKDCRWDTGTPDGGRYTCNPYGYEGKEAEVVVMGKREF